MANNLSKLSDKEFAKLAADVEKEKVERGKRQLTAAREAAEAAANRHGFSLNDLMGTKKAGAKRAPAAPKYRNPADASQTWSGRGRQPAWFKEAISKGTDPEKMAI